MRIETAAGIQINTGRKAPLTRALRETLNRLSGKDLYIVSPSETYWVETLTNPKKPSIWAGKGPSFDSDGGNEYWDIPQNFWRVLKNGYMTHYKCDDERATEMFRDGRVDMIQTFEGSRNRESIGFDSMYDDGNRSDGKHGRNDRYKAKRSMKLSSICPPTTRKMKTDKQWAKEARKGCK